MPVMHNFKPQQLILTDDDKPAFVTLPLIVRLSLALIVGNRATRPYPNYKQYADYLRPVFRVPQHWMQCCTLPIDVGKLENTQKPEQYIKYTHHSRYCLLFQRSLKQRT